MSAAPGAGLTADLVDAFTLVDDLEHPAAYRQRVLYRVRHRLAEAVLASCGHTDDGSNVHCLPCWFAAVVVRGGTE